MGRPRSRTTAASATDVKLERLNWKQFQERLAANKNIKYTIVDAWSTTCGPCKENFPHLIEMHRKYAKQGLAVISLSLDDPTDKAAVAEAEKFLEEKKAAFTNVLLDENFGEGFEKLEYQCDSRGLRLWSRRQGAETVHHGRSQQSVHLRRSRKGDRGPS